MSPTHFSFGLAAKSRSSRSRARSTAASSAIVVRRFLPRRTPSSPARASAARPGRGRPRPRAGAAPSRSCGRRRRAGSRLRAARSRRRARGRRARGGRLPGPARVVRAHRHADRRQIGSTPKSIPPRPPRSGSPSPGRVELRREIHGRVLQDRVRALQLRVLLPQPLQLLALARSSADRDGDRCRPPPAAPSAAAPPCGCPDHARHARSAGPTRTPAAPPAHATPRSTSSGLP